MKQKPGCDISTKVAEFLQFQKYCRDKNWQWYYSESGKSIEVTKSWELRQCRKMVVTKIWQWQNSDCCRTKLQTPGVDKSLVVSGTGSDIILVSMETCQLKKTCGDRSVLLTKPGSDRNLVVTETQKLKNLVLAKPLQ